MTSLAIPPGAALRVVGDVHGDAVAFRYAAAAQDRFIVQLGDLTDHGPDSPGVLRLMFELIDQGRGLFLLGNHDLKLARILAGQALRDDRVAQATAAQLDPPLRARVLQEVARAPAWILQGNALFVHGGFHTDMLDGPAPPHGLDRPRGALARALYGEPTGRMQPDGFPERSLRWVDRIPHGLTVYCGHDRRSSDGRPYVRAGALGGRAVFLDTGAGKGGHLSWIDLPPLALESRRSAAPPPRIAPPLHRSAAGYRRS
ncbi:MAG: phosphatase [Rhodospirillales bacterium 69-11]|nr:metallophosphoesterase [Rhodospirillales bacterium]OJW28960.1 MAG: phosphatase [Rhodospirillales bacterium 69-11]